MYQKILKHINWWKIFTRIILMFRAGSSNRDATADAENHRQHYMIDAPNPLVILKWSKYHPESHYLKIAILFIDSGIAV